MRREQDAILRVEGAVSRLAGGHALDVEEAQRARRGVGVQEAGTDIIVIVAAIPFSSPWLGGLGELGELGELDEGPLRDTVGLPARDGAVVLVLLLHSPLARLLPAAFEA